MKPESLSKGQPLRVQIPGNANVFLPVQLVQCVDGVLFLVPEEGSTASVPEEFFKLGTKVWVGMVNTLGLHTLNGVVLGLIDGVYQIEVKSEFRSQQLRQFFRAPYGEKVSLRVLSASREELVNQQDEAMAVDLSAGGMQLSTQLPLHVDDVVQVEFGLGNDKDKQRLVVAFEGTVRRCVPTARNSFTLGIQFRAPSMKAQDRVVAYLLRRQTPLG